MVNQSQKLRTAVEQLSKLTDEDWALCEKRVRKMQLKKGEHFIEEGKTYKHIGFVVSGLLRAFYLVDGEEINCNFYFEGHWAKAYHSFLTQAQSRMWVTCMEDTELLLLSYDDIQELFSKSKNWERFGRLASEMAFISSQLRTETLLLDKPEVRYLKMTELHPQILERVPLFHLASYIGIKQPSLSRIRKRLARRSKSAGVNPPVKVNQLSGIIKNFSQRTRLGDGSLREGTHQKDKAKPG